MSTFDLRPSLASYIETLISWRNARYQDDLRDSRNLQSANGLELLAGHVRGLPEDDVRIRRLAEIAASGSEFLPGQQTAYELGRFRFYDETTDPDTFLDFVVATAERDFSESGRFGGCQVPGDDPWGAATSK